MQTAQVVIRVIVDIPAALHRRAHVRGVPALHVVID